MGLLQRAYETYNNNPNLVGEYRQDESPLAPVGHIVGKAEIEITLNKDGLFVSANKVAKGEEETIIPVTESSAGRTAGVAPHALCEQIKYMYPHNKEHYESYINQLCEWAESEFSDPKIIAVLKYIKSGMLIDDLKNTGLIQIEEGKIKNEKALIRWSVIGMEENSAPCWKDKNLFKKWESWYTCKRESAEIMDCVTGEIKQNADQHLKGIVSNFGNAKIISSNDNSGFTYRGRFENPDQAVTVSYEVSQKAHNMLKWLVSNHGVIRGNRAFVCWSPSSKEKIDIFSTLGISDEPVSSEVVGYKNALQKTLNGFNSRLPERENIIIVSFEAATNGRLAITYYNELFKSDFINRIYDWDSSCCWWNGKFGIQSPSLFKIVECSSGRPLKENEIQKLKVDDKIFGQQLSRLLACRIDKARLPEDIVAMLVNRSSSPQAYDDALWEKILFVTCAVLNRYYSNTQKKGDIMAWRLDAEDRSFQFGRLLAALERVELDYYSKTEENRQTQAKKLMSRFRKQPFSTYALIDEHLEQAYLPRIETWKQNRYMRLKGEIVEILSRFPEDEINKPLDYIYLMGYDMQRNDFFRKKETEEEK